MKKPKSINKKKLKEINEATKALRLAQRELAAWRQFKYDCEKRIEQLLTGKNIVAMMANGEECELLSNCCNAAPAFSSVARTNEGDYCHICSCCNKPCEVHIRKWIIKLCKKCQQITNHEEGKCLKCKEKLRMEIDESRNEIKQGKGKKLKSLKELE